MAKLRKMLEDVHMESEQSIHMLKKTHQQAMMELQEQISAISRWAYILCSIQLSCGIVFMTFAWLSGKIDTAKLKTNMRVRKSKANSRCKRWPVECKNMSCSTVLTQCKLKTKIYLSKNLNYVLLHSVARSKETIVKEKSRMQVEIQELMAQIEVYMSEKTSMKKVVERLEIQVHEYNVKMEELTRTCNEVQVSWLTNK